MYRQRSPCYGDTPRTEEEPTEYTSLLPKPADIDDPEDSYRYDSHSSDEEGWRQYLTELWILFKGSIPVILAYTLQNSLQTVSVLIVGRSSPENLATTAFSLMFAMITAWMIALGGTTALDTLASSTFTGSSNKHDLGVLLQRGFFVLSLFYIPVAILWACSEPVFLLLGQDPQLSRDSARFLTCLIPGGLGYIYFEVMKKYLQAQVLYARFIAGSECWGGWSREAFQNLGTFARLAFLGIIHVGTEWWAFEIVALAAGRLGTIALAAQSVIMTADQVLNTIPFGVGVATSARVGNLLGSRNAPGAAKAANTAAWLSILLGGVVLAVLMGTRHDFAKIFNSDERVVRLTADVLPYVALFQIADGLNGSCGGSLRGMGRQHVGAMVNLVSYYCGALPLGIWLAFHGWGLKGLWVGQCIALYLVGALEWMIVALSNWSKEVDKAFSRMDVHERLEDGM
ncbi:hypothetical protein APSETT444_006134 [Aspergillus pseudonomiae]